MAAPARSDAATQTIDMNSNCNNSTPGTKRPADDNGEDKDAKAKKVSGESVGVEVKDRAKILGTYVGFKFTCFKDTFVVHLDFTGDMLLGLLECPVCFETARAGAGDPFSCSNGHVLCQLCRKAGQNSLHFSLSASSS